MDKFSYTVKDKKGNVTSGTVEGTDRDEAVKILQDQGFTPLKITKESVKNPLSRLDSFTTVPARDKVLFAEELSTLINAGVPIAQSLSILEKQTQNKRLKGALSELSKEVEGGTSLSNAMEKHKDIFSPIFVNMVRAGEISGTMDEALKSLAVQLNKDHELVSKIRSAMIYPSVILVGMLGAVIYLMVSIVPMLKNMFDELGGTLPATTRSLIFISNALTKYGILTFLLVAGFVFGFRYAEKNFIPFRKLIHRFFLIAPVIKLVSSKMNVAHFARTLSSLLSSGVGVVEALNIVADSTSNLLYKEAIEKAADKVKNGSPIAEAIRPAKIFPSLVPEMIAVGEETGSLDTILKKVADFYEREVDALSANLSTMIEPIMMLAIGVMVGYVIISIITPIYSLTNMF